MTGIIIKNFGDDISVNTLKNIFQVFGDVKRYRIFNDEHDNTKKVGFITYEDRESAIKAIQYFNGKNALGGTNLYVGFVTKNIGGQESYGASNLFIKNLDYSIDQERLKQEFSIFGEVVSVKVLKDNDGRSNGCGFVCYKTVEDATRAVIFMNKKKIGKKQINVEFGKSANTSETQSRTTYIKQLLNIETNSNQQFDKKKNKITSVPAAPAAAATAIAADAMLSNLLDKAFASTSTASNLTKIKNDNKNNNNLSMKEIKKKKNRVRKKKNAKTVSTYEEYSTKTIKGTQLQTNNDTTTSDDDDDDDEVEDKKDNQNDGNNKKYDEQIGLISGVLNTLPEDEQKKLLYELLLPQVERLYPSYGEKILKMLIRLNMIELIKMFEDNTLMEARCSGIFNMMKLRTKSVLGLNNP